MARRILDVIADVLTLLALTLAAVMHVAFNGNRLGMLGDPGADVWWNAWLSQLAGPNLIGSGICLGFLGLLVVVSLLVTRGPQWLARLGVLAMFGASLGAMLFQVMLLTAYARSRVPMQAIRAYSDGYVLLVIGLVATGVAIVCSLARMIWTMPSFGSAEPTREVRPGVVIGPESEDLVLLETERVTSDEMGVRPGKEA